VVEQYAGRAAEKEIDLSAKVAEGLPPIIANELRITQAIRNLVSNAVKYTPEGGRVLVEAKLGEGTIRMSVTDNGPGISAEDQSRLFKEFSRVGSQETRGMAGTGLGLAIVRSVVESIKGRVWVESELGEGSTFVIELPLGS
jgi:signal transduction histidine kinase